MRTIEQLTDEFEQQPKGELINWYSSLLPEEQKMFQRALEIDLDSLAEFICENIPLIKA